MTQKEQEQQTSTEYYYVSPDGGWIMKDEETCLWLPLDYSAQTVAVSGPKMAIGTISGKVLIFFFQRVKY